MAETLSWKWSHSPDAARTIAATSVHKRLMFARGGAGTRLLPRRPPGRAPPPPRCQFSPPSSPQPPSHRRSFARPRTWLSGASSEDEPRPEPPGESAVLGDEPLGAMRTERLWILRARPVAPAPGSPGASSYLRRGHVTAPRQRCSGAVVRCYPVPDGTTCVHYGLNSLHHDAASSGSADISYDLDLPADPAYHLGSLSHSNLANSPWQRRSRAIRECRSSLDRQRSLLVSRGLMQISRAVCVENGLRDASAVWSSVRPIRRASRVRSAAAASGRGERRGGGRVVHPWYCGSRNACDRQHCKNIPDPSLPLRIGARQTDPSKSQSRGLLYHSLPSRGLSDAASPATNAGLILI